MDDVKLIVNHFAPAPGFTPKAGMDFKRIKPLHDRTDGVAEENKGYYVLAPNYDFRDGDTNSPLKPTLKIDVGTDADTNKPTGLTYTIPAKNDDLNDLPNHTVLLQKLANPYLAHHDQNNPYITIDFLENIPHSDAVDRLETGVHSADPADGRKSRGRIQPYTAHSSQIVNQSPTNALDGTQHTFFLRNNPNENANWLFQADRHLVSSVELLNVADSPPHQLTQNIVKNNQ